MGFNSAFKGLNVIRQFVLLEIEHVYQTVYSAVV